jgi:hypothetical protein
VRISLASSSFGKILSRLGVDFVSLAWASSPTVGSLPLHGTVRHCILGRGKSASRSTVFCDDFLLTFAVYLPI